MAEDTPKLPSQMAEGNSRDNHDAGSDEGGELDEQTMEAIINGTLPETAETCLALNLVYQELVQGIMRHTEACLAQNREKQRYLESELRNSSTERRQMAKIPLQTYIPPYFKDASGLAPLQNDDGIAKANELNPLVNEARKWTPAEKERLSKAVKYGLARVATESHVDRRQILREKMTVISDAKELADMTKEIRSLDKAIEVTKSKVDLANAREEDIEAIDWTLISVSEFAGSRSPMECRLCWFHELDPRLDSSDWKQDEIMKLGQLAEKFGMRDWKSVAQEMGTSRTPFQYFEKYQKELNPNIIKQEWNDEDDAKLREAVQICRNGEFIPWDQVSNLMEGRTREQCKTRWMRALTPGLKRGAWDEEEDLLLLHAVEKVGRRDWTRVSKFVPGRTELQCRERWSIVLLSGQKFTAWTPDEDALLVDGVRQFGAGQWSKICNLFEGRPPHSCKARYRSLMASKESPAVTTERCRRRQQTQAQRRQARYQRTVEYYTRMVGHAPVLKKLHNDAARILGHLPREVQSIFREKLESVRNRAAHTFAMRKRNRAKEIERREVKRLQQDIYESDMFRTILAEPRNTPDHVHLSTRPTRRLASLIVGSKSLLPPTSGTLSAFRTLVSWHGADLLVGGRLDQVYSRSFSSTNSILTNKTTTEMRSYLDERGDQSVEIDQPNTSSCIANAKLDCLPMDLLPNDAGAMRSFVELRETFRQLFMWPAILATFPTMSEGDQ